MMLTRFGYTLREFRIKRDMLLMDMSKAIGLSSAAISAIENGRVDIPPNFVKIICHKLNASDDERDVLTKAQIPFTHAERLEFEDSMRRKLNYFTLSFHNMESKK